MSLKKIFVLPQILLSLHEVRFLHCKEKQQISAPTFIHPTFNFWNAFSLSRVDYVCGKKTLLLHWNIYVPFSLCERSLCTAENWNIRKIVVLKLRYSMCCTCYFIFIKSTEEIVFSTVSFQIQVTVGNGIREQRLRLPLKCDHGENKRSWFFVIFFF